MLSFSGSERTALKLIGEFFDALLWKTESRESVAKIPFIM